jgi:predicted dehydrogenase
MKVLIIGAGMYVTGRGETGVGTLLASLAELSKGQHMEVTIAARKKTNARVVREAAERINRTLKSKMQVHYEVIATSTSLKALHRKHHYDCGIVSVPDHLHFTYGKALLELGIPTMVVKPLTPTLDEAKKLVATQEKEDVYGVVEFHKRWDETNLIIQREIKNKTLGKLLYFTVDYSQKINIPLKVFKEWSDKTNIFQYLGVHYVDLIFFLTGYRPSKVSGLGTTGILKQKGVNTYDSVHASIIWQNPAKPVETFVSQFNCNWIDPNITSAMSDQKYKVIGTKGRFECDQKNRGLELVHESVGIQQINPYFSEFLPDSGQLAFNGYAHKSVSAFINDVAELVEGRTTREKLETYRPTFKSSLVSVAVVDAVNTSLADGGKWKQVNGIG